LIEIKVGDASYLEQGRIRQKQLFEDRFGLNALNQYLRRFQHR